MKLRLTVNKNLAPFVLPLLIISVAALYAPVWDANFQGDDWRYVHFFYFNFQSLLDGHHWDTLFSASYGWDAGSYFRPMLQLTYLQDYIAWGLNATGYRLSNLILHILTAYLVYVLGVQLTHQRWVGGLASVLFAIMPIHVEAVSWIGARADGLNAFWYLAAIVFFIFYRARRKTRHLIWTIIAFILALLSKEAGVTLPLVLLFYDILYQLRRWRSWRFWLPQIIVWSILAAFLSVRFLMWGNLSAYAGGKLANIQIDRFWSDYFALLLDPLAIEMKPEWAGLLLGGWIILLLVLRSRRELWFGSAWLVLTIVPSLLSMDAQLFDRYAYLPSIGLSIAEAGLVMYLYTYRNRLAKLAAGVGLATLLIAYAPSLYQRNREWARAAQITNIVIDQMRVLHPTLPTEARLVFTNVPVLVGPRQMQAFGGKLNFALQLMYKNPRLEIFNLPAFPLWLDKLDASYFFEYGKRTLAERADVAQRLDTLARCQTKNYPALEWDFARDAQAWEPWHQLTAFQSRDGALTMTAEGNDPYLASPEFDLPAEAIGSILIDMRVQAQQPSVQAMLYWRAASEVDFSPKLLVPFQVQADDSFHVYQLNLTNTRDLKLGDRILRLRLDPSDAPAEIAIRSIRVYSHCVAMQGDRCVCRP